MKTFFVSGLDVTSGLAAIMAACSTSRDAFLSRGDVVDMVFDPKSVWRAYRRGIGI